MRMTIILWIIFGASVGWITSLFLKSTDSAVWDVVVGTLGAVVSGLLVSLASERGAHMLTPYSYIVILLGACALIALVRELQRS